MNLELERLERDGIVGVGEMSGADEVNTHLMSCVQYHGHVMREGFPPQRTSSATCWSMRDVLHAPHFLEYALEFTGLAAEYLGVKTPLLYSVNAFVTYPSALLPNPDIQVFHRDKDDTRFLALFVYLTRILHPDDGAHVFKAGTHRGIEDGDEHIMLGGVGRAFLADTRGLHMGIRPTTHSRAMMWARWGVSDPPKSYLDDKLSPIAWAEIADRFPEGHPYRDTLRLVVR